MKVFVLTAVLSLPLALFDAHAQSLRGPQSSKPIALIYDGEGNCKDGCVEAALEVALKAGLTPKRVKPDAITEKSTEKEINAIFGNTAKVWIQPGGIANVSIATMNPRLVEKLIEFVAKGGGYVGFCAGAFMATEEISNSGNSGLGIFPGRNKVYGAWPIPGFEYSLEKVIWNGKMRQVFFEGGPYFYGFEYDPRVEIIATYEGGYPAAARTVYQKGRVFITGLHPEAPRIWTEEDQVVDPDGVDQDLAVEMIRWSAGLKIKKKLK